MEYVGHEIGREHLGEEHEVARESRGRDCGEGTIRVKYNGTYVRQGQDDTITLYANFKM